MGQFYEEGKFVLIDLQRAQDLFEEACDAAHAEACNNVAVAKMQKYEQDYQKIVAQLNSSVAYRSVVAQTNLAYLYSSGKGVEENQKYAYELYPDAVYKGSNIGQFRLAWQYYKGIEIKKNYPLVYTLSIVPELDKSDDVVGWEPELPINARHYLDNLLNRKQMEDAKVSADTLLREIEQNVEKRRHKTLYKRGDIYADGTSIYELCFDSRRSIVGCSTLIDDSFFKKGRCRMYNASQY